MIVLHAAVSPRGPAHAVYRLFEDGALRLFVSEESLEDIADVLTRPAVTRKFGSLTADRVAEQLQQLRTYARPKPDVPRVFVCQRDPKDERYANLAIAAGARYLVTWDRDLLDLMDESLPDGRAFRAANPALLILTPPDLIRALRATDAQGLQPGPAP
jgi:putative PIN family toxin of toxin-antitoxin system